MSQYFKVSYCFFLVCFLALASAHSKPAHIASDSKQNTLYISLDFQEISVRAVLQKLAKEVGCNLIIDNKVQGLMSIHIHRMPITQALALVLKTQTLAKKQIGNTWIISSSETPATLTDLNHITRVQPILASKKLSLRHREAQDIAKLFLGKEASSKTRYTQLSIDEQSNSLWIEDTPERVKRLEQLIQQFDHPIPQILIEARIVSVDRNFERELGIRFGLSETNEATGSTLTSVHQLTPENSNLHTINKTLNIDLHATPLGQAALFGLALVRLGKQHLLDLELSALESAGGGQIISSPHLITMNRTEAVISAGLEIPYQGKAASKNTKRKTTSTNTNASRNTAPIHFKKAALTLKITPHLIENKSILLNLQLNQDQPNELKLREIPIIDTRALKTQVIVNPGETIVLGGIYERVQNQAIRRVPFLSNLPLFGVLFNHRIHIDKTKELLIFVTPHILIP